MPWRSRCTAQRGSSGKKQIGCAGRNKVKLCDFPLKPPSAEGVGWGFSHKPKRGGGGGVETAYKEHKGRGIPPAPEWVLRALFRARQPEAGPWSRRIRFRIRDGRRLPDS